MRDDGPVVVVAGSGALPAHLVSTLDREGRERRVLALAGFADRALRRRADRVVDLVDVAGILDQLAAWAPSAITLAGGVRRPSLPVALRSGAAAWRNRKDIAAVFAKGDDHLLRGIVAFLEEQGHRVVGAHEIAPDLLAPVGRIGARAPSVADLRAIRTGFACIDALSPFDVGQACVAVDERILAIEGAEGTDRMLERVGRLGRGLALLRRDRPPGGVLVKAAKTGQDLRVDLAASGPRTIRNAAASGLSGVALGAGIALMIERDAMIAEADRLGLFLVGVDPAHPEASLP